MDDSEPTLNTEPSSSAMRARAFTWVLTRSSQSTEVFADAVMVFPLRAIFTTGITRETSPARCTADWGAAQTSVGIATSNESSKASPKANRDFIFIEDSPGFITVRVVSQGSKKVDVFLSPGIDPIGSGLHQPIEIDTGLTMRKGLAKQGRPIVYNENVGTLVSLYLS